MEDVRIDKYLWSIRAFKTRSDATTACNGGKVRLNGADVKPSKPVRVGDTIVVRKGAVTYTYKVLALVDKRQGPKLVPEYAENLTPQEELDKLRAPVETFFLKETEEPAVRPKKTVVRWTAFGKPLNITMRSSTLFSPVHRLYHNQFPFYSRKRFYADNNRI